MEEIQELLAEMESIKSKQKALDERESICKKELMEALKANGIEKDSGLYGSIRIQRKTEKDYGPFIRDLEVQLKEAKKLSDDMGDYTVIGTKESLVYTPPKLPF